MTASKATREAAAREKERRRRAIIDSLKEGVTMSEIARRHGCHRKTIARLCGRDEEAAAARRFGRWRVRLRRAQRFARKVREERRATVELEIRIAVARRKLAAGFADASLEAVQKADRRIAQLMDLRARQDAVINARLRDLRRALGYIRARRCAA